MGKPFENVTLPEGTTIGQFKINNPTLSYLSEITLIYHDLQLQVDSIRGEIMDGKKLKEINTALIVVAVVYTLLMAMIFAPMNSGSDAINRTRDESDTMVSIYTGTPPRLDNMEIWEDIPEMTVSVAGGNNPSDVSLKSMYNDTHIFVMAEWTDPTLSMVRGGPWIYNPITEGTVRSVKTDMVPVIDGDISDAVWDKAQPLYIPVSGGNNPGIVTVKSLYNDTHVFIQSQWGDPTFSILRGGGSWLWNDTGDEEWTHTLGGSEDRIAFQWDMNTTDFETQGCFVKCHGDPVTYLSNPGERTDIWHMKAARSLGAIDSMQIGTPTIVEYQPVDGEFILKGYADDKYVTYDEEPWSEDGGRHGDGGGSTYARNRNASKGAPKYIEKDPYDWLDAMILNQFEIDAGETWVADPDDVANYDAQNVKDAWDNYDTLGAVVPERIIRPPTGSRGDVLQSGKWVDEMWTVETMRLLETGNDDDVQFDDLSKTYDFGVSVMENTGGSGHDFHSGSYHLDFASDFVSVSGNSEDRIAFLWNIENGITDFENQGCMVKCHVADGKAYLNVPGEIGDIWHMKSARSLPVLSSTQSGTPTIVDHQATIGRFEFHGYVDDKHITHDEEPFGEDGGRLGDDGSSTYARNRNAEETAPLYLEKDPMDFADAMALTQAEIDGGETWEVATAFDTDIANAAKKYEYLNAIIPERILRLPTGSRADILQSAIWENGTWRTIINRELITGNDDDIQFDDIKGSYSFGLSLMDNSGGSGHDTTGSSIYWLIFDTPNLPPIDVDAGEDQTVFTDSTATFTGTATDPENDTLTYTWTFGDGTGIGYGQEVTYVYEDIGTYTVSMMVDDDHGNEVTDTLTLTVEYGTRVVHVGPILDDSGNLVDGAKVTIEHEGPEITGTTGADGIASITIPSDLTGKDVIILVTKSGFEYNSFSASISASGEVIPDIGSYPPLDESYEDDDNEDSFLPGFEFIVLILSFALAFGFILRKRLDYG